MIKVLFDKKRIIKYILLACLCGFVIVCVNITSIDEFTMETAFLASRDGYIDIAEKEFSSEPIICSLWLLLFVPLITNLLSEDCEVAKNFVFIRLENLGKWFDLKMFQGFIYSVLVSSAYNVSMMFVVALMGYKAESLIKVMAFTVYGSLAGALFLFLFVMVTYVMMLKIPTHISVVVMVFSITAMLVGMLFIYNDNILQYFLITNYFISWHMKVNTNNAMYSYPTWVYYTMICIVEAVIYFIGRKVMKKSDQI